MTNVIHTDYNDSTGIFPYKHVKYIQMFILSYNIKKFEHEVLN